MVQDTLFGQALRDKQMRKERRKVRLDDWHKERIQRQEAEERRLRLAYQQPMHMWTPEMKKRYNDLQARRHE